MDIFLFITLIISLLATPLTVYLLCKQETLDTNNQSGPTSSQRSRHSNTEEIYSECKTMTYITLVLTILGLVMVAILYYRKSKLCRE